ncbi:MAG: MFS transporter [Proteobacteria bacterium]|nr:MFS transporter [Pseudomonadota bacterium]
MNSNTAQLTSGIKLGWAIGELAIAVYIGITMAFFLFYLTEVLKISPVWAGTVLLVPRLWDAFTDPFMGAISDRTRSSMGRRRPYLLVGSILFGVSFWLVLSPPPVESELGKAIYFTCMYMLVSTCYTIFDVPYSSMAAEMSSDYKERVNLTGYKMMAARLGIIVAAMIGPIIYNSQDSLQEGFALLGAVGGVFITVTGLVAFFATRNAPRLDVVPQRFRLRDELSAIIRNRPFANLFLVFLLQNLAIGASATALIYFLTITMQVGATMIGPLFAIAGVAALLATPGWVYIGNRLGKKKAYARAMTINLVMAISLFFLPPSLAMLLFGVYVINGFADAGNQLMPNSMVPDTVEVDELESGVRREGAIFGAWAFCRKTGMAGGAFLASLCFSAFGFVSGAETQTAEASWGIRVAFSALPFVLWFFAIRLLARYELSEEKFNAIKSRLKASTR